MDRIALILFNEKVARLDRCAFAKQLQANTYALQVARALKFEFVALEGIDEDDVDAFVLNARLLIQDGDGFSIRALSKLYSGSAVPKLLANAFEVQRARLKAHLRTRIPTKLMGRQYTYGHLWNVILYGGLAHNNRKYYEEFIFLSRQGAASALGVFPMFMATAKCLFSVVKEISKLNSTLLGLTSSKPSKKMVTT